jgi:hypothetical protein
MKATIAQRIGLDWVVRVGGTVLRAGFAEHANAQSYLDQLETLERKHEQQLVGADHAHAGRAGDDNA